MDCKCTMSQRLTGDGCEICNPAQALEYAKETISDLEAERDQYLKQLNEALKDNCMLKYRLAKQRKALESISKNTCCDKYQEAALVAKQALEVSDVD